MKKILKTKKPKMLLSLFLVIAIMFNIAPINVFATYDDEHGYNYYSGGFTTANGIKYTYTTGTASTYRPLVTGAAGRWSNASSHVSLTLYTATNNYGLYIAPIVVSALEYAPENSTQLGRMYPYKSFTPTSATSATNSETWVKAYCYIYNNSVFNVTGYPTEYRNKLISHTVTHEMGHALSVGHINPNGTYEPTHIDRSVMTTGPCIFYTLDTYDINMLRAKWGN